MLKFQSGLNLVTFSDFLPHRLTSHLMFSEAVMAKGDHVKHNVNLSTLRVSIWYCYLYTQALPFLKKMPLKLGIDRLSSLTDYWG